MSILVIFLMAELGWIVGAAYMNRGDSLGRFIVWLTAASTVAMLGCFMVLAWLAVWPLQRPDFSLWWLVAIIAVNIPLALLWKRRVEELSRPAPTPTA